MNIAILGYGKMGQAIEEIALQRGHQIVCRINIDNLEERTVQNIRKADVAIEFTGPHTAFENVIFCMEAGVPLVCGSTGWLDHFEEAKKSCLDNQGSLLYASNFSIGVNIFFALNKKLAQLMAGHSSYNVELKEIHHTQKLDAPSGTAITLAEQILQNLEHKTKWVNRSSDIRSELPIISERLDPAPGTHLVKYTSDIDDIEIIHTAHNRKGFASGAVFAAEFIQNKKGIYTMAEALGIDAN